MDSPLSIAAFVIGVTQLSKHLGVQGRWLMTVATLAGALATWLSTYQPALWASLSTVLIGLTTTGLVSFADDRIQKLNAPAAE